MAEESEKSIETKICKYAKSKGCLVYKFTSPNQAGVPDRMFLFEGKTLFIEVKRKGGKVSMLQNFHIEKLRGQGFNAVVAYNAEQGKQYLDDYIFTN